MINSIDKLKSGVPGLDQVASGGLPKGRTTMICGTSGSAKTVISGQFLVQGVREGGGSVFVTFEESPDDIRRNFQCFGWDVEQWEAENRWRFVDGSMYSADELVEAGSYDLGGLLSRVEHAIREVDAGRVVMDSLGAVFSQFRDRWTVRRELFRISQALKRLGMTSVVTIERPEDFGPISRDEVEEFVADNVVVLRNVLEDEKRRRTVEILKFRGTHHQSGQWPFTIVPDEGIVVIPLSAIELTQESSEKRITSGIAELDKMCGGGFFRDSLVLVSGATGTGKTLTATHFIAGGAQSDERCLLFAFEESRQQLFRNASGWGVDFAALERAGQLRVECVYPEVACLEDHLLRIKRVVDEFKPHRVAVDSVSALERVGTLRGFREFLISMTSHLKHEEIAGLFTATTPTLMGGESVTESHFSTITDSIILLRYVEVFGEMKRGLTVLKMRGSKHDKNIRGFDIDHTGMHIGMPFRNVMGILSGDFKHISAGDLERFSELYRDLQ